MKPVACTYKSTMILFTAILMWTWAPAVFGAERVNTGTFGDTAIKGYDPVAYFTEGKPVKGSKTHTHEWNGAVWRFSSGKHRDLFAASPSKYAPRYGGWCAWAMAEGKKVKIDPQAWHIYEDKLYLNYNAKIQKRWLSDRAKRISDADAQWEKITGAARK